MGLALTLSCAKAAHRTGSAHGRSGRQASQPSRWAGGLRGERPKSCARQ